MNTDKKVVRRPVIRENDFDTQTVFESMESACSQHLMVLAHSVTVWDTAFLRMLEDELCLQGVIHLGLPAAVAMSWKRMIDR